MKDNEEIPVWENWKERAEKAEARVAELEARNALLEEEEDFAVEHAMRRWCVRAVTAEAGLREASRQWKERAEQAEARVAELTPPERHVAVMLPHEIVEIMARVEIGTDFSHTITKAAKKSLRTYNPASQVEVDAVQKTVDATALGEYDA